MSDEANACKELEKTNWCLEFEIKAKCSTTRARSSVMKLANGKVSTPVFMPVGTQGAIKGVTVDQLNEIGVEIILGNTYHLGTRPGSETMKTAKGLHNFMNWGGCILTDSGGYQMVSLSELKSVTEEGVEFKHPIDGSMLTLTPEESMKIQQTIGSDIVMQLDDVVSSLTTGPRVEEAMHRSVRWLDRALTTFHPNTKQNLFAIIQGGLDPELRQTCLEEMCKRPVPGFAIGGLSGGEAKEQFWKTVKQCTEILPNDKPRYLMGVGYAAELVVCSALGCDMFDCVYPTRTARFATALTFTGDLRLKSAPFKYDYRPIEPSCNCYTCSNFTRAYLNQQLTLNTSALSLITIHNLTFQKRLMAQIRSAIEYDEFPSFIKKFMKNYFRDEIPQWIRDALKSVDVVDLDD